MDGRRAIWAGSLLCLVLGSVHAFSVFLTPLELQFGAGRAAVAMSYSLALVSLTLAVLFCHRLTMRVSARRFVFGLGVVGVGGLALASVAPSLSIVWLGYSLIFGFANGLGYAFSLQISGRCNPGREGVAMGVVTAAYAVGATIAPVVFVVWIEVGGFALAMIGLAASLLVVTLAVAGLSSDDHRCENSRGVDATAPTVSIGEVGRFWLGYGAGVAAGLMVIGHAAGMAASASTEFGVWLAPSAVAVMNMAGSFCGGWFADRMSSRILLFTIPSLSAAALLVLAGHPAGAALILALGLVGFAYGATIAAYPAVISKRYGSSQGARIYGRVFTAWGAAGLVAPVLAGWFYDRSGDYTAAIWFAFTLSLASALVALCQK